MSSEITTVAPSELIAIHRCMAHPDWPIFRAVLERMFCMDEAVFQRDATGRVDTHLAAKRDGQRDVMNFIRNARLAPTPSEDEETNEPE